MACCAVAMGSIYMESKVVIGVQVSTSIKISYMLQSSGGVMVQDAYLRPL